MLDPLIKLTKHVRNKVTCKGLVLGEGACLFMDLSAFLS